MLTQKGEEEFKNRMLNVRPIKGKSQGKNKKTTNRDDGNETETLRIDPKLFSTSTTERNQSEEQTATHVGDNHPRNERHKVFKRKHKRRYNNLICSMDRSSRISQLKK
ncbi:hypothetical protein [Sphingobacterium sp.]|uniref:hypothetical protein n=1 Tax=Sphingobacterium sp. TaxID=341027 RepID=UPI002FD8FB26